MNVQQASMLVASTAGAPTHDDWRVSVWYRAWNGKDKRRTIAVCTSGSQLSEAQAVERALDSLRKTLMEKVKGKPAWFWQLPPKVYDVKAEPYFKKHGTVRALSKYDEMIARFRATP